MLKRQGLLLAACAVAGVGMLIGCIQRNEDEAEPGLMEADVPAVTEEVPAETTSPVPTGTSRASVPTMVALRLDPNSVGFTAVGQTKQVLAVGRFSDDTSRDLNPTTDGVAFDSSNSSVASISASGLVTAVGAGSTSVTGHSGKLAGQVAVSVTILPPDPPPAAPPDTGTPSSPGTPGEPALNRLPNLALPADDVTAPSTWVSLSASATDADGDALSYQWVQDAGPPVVLQNAATAVVQFLTPEDTGEEQIIRLRLTVSDGKGHVEGTVEVHVIPATVVPAGGADGHESTLFISSTPLAHVNVLPSPFTEFSIGFSSSDGANFAETDYSPYVYLNRAPALPVEATALFAYDPATWRLSLKPEAVDDFEALLTDDLMELRIGGPDTQDLGVNLVLNFYYGSNTLQGTVLDPNGQPLYELAGEEVSLCGFALGSNRTTAIGPDGAYVFDDLPTDVYAVTLLTSTGEFAHGVVPFYGGGYTKTADLVVGADGGGPAPSLSSGGKRSGDLLVYGEQLNGAQHLRAKPPAKRDGTAPEARSPFAPLPEPLLLDGGNPWCEPVSATSSAEDVEISAQADVEIPQGQASITLYYKISSHEYPYWTGQNSKYNDKFAYAFSVQGQMLWSGNGAVNPLHTSFHSDGSTDWYTKVVDVATLTQNGPITVRMWAAATNVGDSLYSTTTTVSIDPGGLTITRFRHSAGLGTDAQGTMCIGVPGYKSTHKPWESHIEYSPKEATLTHLSILFRYGQSTVIQELSQAELAHVITAPGTIELRGNYATRFTAGLPACLGATRVSLAVVLEGTVNGTTLTSPETPMRTVGNKEDLVPLSDVGEVLGAARRYSTREEGGDGWSRASVYTWLCGSNADVIVNDCSLEHGGPFVPHHSHRSGTSADVRYFGPPSGDNGLNGAGDASARKQLLDDAQAELVAGTPPANAVLQRQLVGWLKNNRTRIGGIAGLADVITVYVGDRAGATWNWRALVEGKYPNGMSIVDPDHLDQQGHPLPIGVWSKSAEIQRAEGHHHHVHLEFAKH